jgi:fatty acid desaturase
MHELRPIRWYASQVAAQLPPEAFKPVLARLWWGALYLTVAVSGILAIGLLSMNVWWNLLLSVAVASAFAGLGFLAHEILHGSVVKTAWLRDLTGAICFWPLGVGPKLWRKWHNMEHHAHTQHEDHDPDAMGTVEKWFSSPLLRGLYKLAPWLRSLVTFLSFFGFFSGFSVRQFIAHVGAFRARERALVVLQFVGPVVFWGGLLPLLGLAKWFFAYLLPLMLANFLVIAYISTNHQLNPLTEVNDPLANSLSVIVPRWVDVLHLNFSHHTEHHLFPGMNPKYAPLVRAKLREMFPDQYHEMPWLTALVTLWKTPRLYHNHTQLTDPERGISYGSLGHGLDPQVVEARPAAGLSRPGECQVRGADL